MSMRLIYGRAGTGKSEFILQEIKKEIKSKETDSYCLKFNKSGQTPFVEKPFVAQKIYIIVPEQFSYATEKRLLETLEEGAAIKAEVISFKRLAHRVYTEVRWNK